MKSNKNYKQFLIKKSQLSGEYGFKPLWIPDFLFDFQKHLVEWVVRKGKGAIFADCGLGKTPMFLVWAMNIVQKTNKRVLIITPLAVSMQTIREGEKFNIECSRSNDGKFKGKIVVTNYERLHYFNPDDFIGVVADESSILKSFNGKTKALITEFMRKIPYRLLCTATAAPNDYHELGTSSEALGELGYTDMLNRFFKNDHGNSATGRKYGEIIKWRLKGHAEVSFWRWIVSWARAVRKPSDIGGKDADFILPKLSTNEHMIKSPPPKGMLLNLPANGLHEQRKERSRTINERCEKVAELVSDTKKPALVWCHLNKEGDLLSKLIPDAVQISGSDSNDVKEEKFLSFIDGNSRILITKPKIGAWGLNLQHCSHVVFFPSHSYEQYYQGIRRCWRFGQKNPVTVDIVMAEGDINVMANLRRKSINADRMFESLVSEMNNSLSIKTHDEHRTKTEVPTWL